MMYISMLLIDTGENPDRPRPGRQWLRNMYRVHQRLCMAFPSKSRYADDPDFLRPYSPQDFSPYRGPDDQMQAVSDANSNNSVHIARGENGGFLFRVDPLPGSARAVILAQSALEPDWEYAFHNAKHLLAAYPETKQFDPIFEPRKSYRFRLLANPVKKICKNSKEIDGKPFASHWHGKRVPVRNELLKQWLIERSEKAGFSLREGDFEVQPGFTYVNKNSVKGGGIRYRSALYEGELKVVDPALVSKCVRSGIGPAKAFGFGLLSLSFTY